MQRKSKMERYFEKKKIITKVNSCSEGVNHFHFVGYQCKTITIQLQLSLIGFSIGMLIIIIIFFCLSTLIYFKNDVLLYATFMKFLLKNFVDNRSKWIE